MKLDKQTKEILKLMPALTTPDGKNPPDVVWTAELVRKGIVQMSLLMGCCTVAAFADDVHPTGKNPYPWTPDELWNMPEFQKIAKTWESDCGRCRGASLKAEYGWKLLATVTDTHTYLRYSDPLNHAPIFNLTKEQIKELANQ